MDKNIRKFGDTENEKHKIHQHKSPILINKIDINEIVVFNKASFGKKGFKYFTAFKHGKKVRHLFILLTKIIAYKRDFNKTKCMSFLIKDDELLEKYNKICEKVSNNIKKGFDSEPTYKEKYLKTKVKSYEGKINTNFHHDKIPMYLSIGIID